MARKLSDAVQSMNVDPSIIQACLAEYTTIDVEMKRLAQKQAAMFGRYEGQGVNKRSIKNAHKMSRLDRAEASAQAQSDARYLIITGILNPADDDWARAVHQSQMFTDAEETETDAPSPATKAPVMSSALNQARAHTDGYNSGKHGGEAANNPYLQGTAEYVQWAKGLSDGLADRKLRGKGATKVASTSKRGRPAGSGKRSKSNGNGAAAEHA